MLITPYELGHIHGNTEGACRENPYKPKHHEWSQYEAGFKDGARKFYDEIDLEPIVCHECGETLKNFKNVGPCEKDDVLKVPHGRMNNVFIFHMLGPDKSHLANCGGPFKCEN